MAQWLSDDPFSQTLLRDFWGQCHGEKVGLQSFYLASHGFLLFCSQHVRTPSQPMWFVWVKAQGQSLSKVSSVSILLPSVPRSWVREIIMVSDWNRGDQSQDFDLGPLGKGSSLSVGTTKLLVLLNLLVTIYCDMGTACLRREPTWRTANTRDT